MFKILSAWSIAAGIGVMAAAAPPAIDRLAPDNSVFIAGVDNCRESMDRFKKTKLWSLWNSPEIQGMLSAPLKECREHLQEMYNELGVEEGLLVAPAGSVGLAVFPGAPDQFEETTPGFLLVADYGDEAEKFGKLVDAAIAKIEQEGEPEYEENEVLGRKVYSFDMSDLELDEVLDMAEEGFGDVGDMGGMADIPMPDPMDMLPIETVHFLRDGSRFMVSSDLEALRGALETIDGDDRAGPAEGHDYQAARGMLGQSDAFAVLLLGDLVHMLGDDDPMAFMMYSMFQSVVGDVKALGLGVRLEAPGSMVEETFAAYMPDGPSGLTALVDHETPRRELPSFVGPKAIGYSSVNFEFGGIMGFLRSLAQSNPMLGAQMNQMLMEQGPLIEQVSEALGPQVHVVASLSRPIELTSLKSLYAIQSSNPAQVEAVLAEFAPAMGLEPRDFLGNRIYTLPFDPFMMGMGGPMMAGAGGDGFSIGFGGGYVMLGNTSVVEDALRTGGKAGMPTLADDPAYRRAIRALTAPQAVGWGVVNIPEYLAYFKDYMDLSQQYLLDQMEQWNPEYAAEMRAEMEAEPPMPWERLDIDALKRYIGPISWQLRARDDGFVGKYFLLEPDE